MKTNMLKLKRIILILFTSYLIIMIGGCAKFVPTEKMINQSKSITTEQAVSILNNNIYLPGPIFNNIVSFDSHANVSDSNYNTYGYDSLTNVEATSIGFKFYNLLDKYNSRKFKEITHIVNIWDQAPRATFFFCYKGDHAISFKGIQNSSFLLCVKDKEASYAAILKLFPGAIIE